MWNTQTAGQNHGDSRRDSKNRFPESSFPPPPSSARSYPEKPDSYKKAQSPPAPASISSPILPKRKRAFSPDQGEAIPDSAPHLPQDRFPGPGTVYSIVSRSEERRVGKESRSSDGNDQ